MLGEGGWAGPQKQAKAKKPFLPSVEEEDRIFLPFLPLWALPSFHILQESSPLFFIPCDDTCFSFHQARSPSGYVLPSDDVLDHITKDKNPTSYDDKKLLS